MTTPTQAQIEAARDLVGQWFIWLWATQKPWIKAMPDEETRDDLINRIAALTAAAQVGETNMNIQNCSKCGGMHFGSVECPIEAEREKTNATIERCAQVAKQRADHWNKEAKGDARQTCAESLADECEDIFAAICKLRDEP